MSGTFTRKEISERYEISVENLKYREKVLDIKPIFKKQKSKAMLYTLSQVEKLVNFNTKDKEDAKMPKIIRITETHYIYPSKMNYDTEN